MTLRAQRRPKKELMRVILQVYCGPRKAKRSPFYRESVTHRFANQGYSFSFLSEGISQLDEKPANRRSAMEAPSNFPRCSLRPF
jgi:hypothetical protein